MGLTAKKLKFVEAKLRGLSNRDAALEAGYAAGSASVAGSKLAKDVHVTEHMARVSAARSKKAAAQTPKPVRQKRSPKVDPESAAKEPAAPPAPPPVPLTPPGDPDDESAEVKAHEDAKKFLVEQMNDETLHPKLRIDAAKALLPFQHSRKGELGKKEEKNARAKAVAGKYTPVAPPLRAIAGGRSA